MTLTYPASPAPAADAINNDERMALVGAAGFLAGAGWPDASAILLRVASGAPMLCTQLLREVYAEFVVDGHGLQFEDGDHPLVDRVRAFLDDTPLASEDGYPTLPAGDNPGAYVSDAVVFSAGDMRAYVAADRALRTQGDTAHPAEGVPARVVSGAVFDFAGYLTTLPVEKAIHASEAHEASPMVEAIKAWAATRGLETAEADVRGWRAALAATPAAGVPAAAPDTESVLIDGVAYETPVAVSVELLRLHLELLELLEANKAQPAVPCGFVKTDGDLHAPAFLHAQQDPKNHANATYAAVRFIDQGEPQAAKVVH